MALAIFLITVLVFWRATANGFVNYDDPDYVTANEHVKAGLSVTSIRWAFSTSDVSYWHPLTWLSHMADWSLFGDSAHGHHAVSVLWHAGNAALVFLVLRRLTGAFTLSAIAALLFALHPLRVESVAWASERKDVLSGFFYLATIWMYAAYAARRDARRSSWLWYLGVMALFAAGLMSKPMVVTLPALLLVLDFWPLRRLSLSRIGVLLLEKIPLLALSGAVSWVTIVAQRNVGTLSTVLPFSARLANAFVGIPRYLGKFFWPVDLAVLYPHPGFWAGWIILLAVLVVIALCAVAIWQWRNRPWIAAGWLWFLVVLLPASGVVQVGIQSMADRYTYLSMLGIEIAMLWTLAGLVPLATRFSAWVVPLAALTALSWHQLGVWSTSLTLFDHTIAVAGKGNYLAYNNRGVALFHDGNIVDAIEAYRQSLAINPGYAEANNNMGEALAREGRLAEAVQYYRKALQLDPRLVEPHNNLANALVDQGAMEEAMQHYRYALEQRPHDPNMLNNYGAALAMSGKLDESIAQIEKALQYAPDYASAHANLGNILAMRGRKEDALAHYRRALALEPVDARTFYNQGNVLTELGRDAEAIESYQRAVQLSPLNPEAHAMLGFVFARVGRRDDSLRELQTALQQRPDYAQARAWLEAVEKAKP